MKADWNIIALLTLLLAVVPLPAVGQDGVRKKASQGRPGVAEPARSKDKSAADRPVVAQGRSDKANTARVKKQETPEKKGNPTGSARETDRNNGGRPNKVAARPSVNRLPAADVEAALRFARKHHPELARLLEKLQGKSELEFNRGIREVHNAAARLERYREKQPNRFEAGLRDWKRDSEIRLLSAKWLVSGDRKLEDRIQQLLRDRMESRIESMKSERDRLAARLEQLDQQINMDTAELEAALAAEWDRLSRRATAASKAKRPERKPPVRKTDKDKKTE